MKHVQSLSIVIPCLNEEKTLPYVLAAAREALSALDIPTEILVADNGSTDRSREICAEWNVRVIDVPERGYGAALDYGIRAAQGSHVIFADADASYDFLETSVILPELEKGADLVVGNRFQGGIAKGAMPFLHRYLGTPVLSFLGRQAFGVRLGDFNCGLRGVKKSAYEPIRFRSRSMAYATEQIARAAMNHWDIREVPVHLHKDKRDRAPHLKTWSDGWRQLRIILLLGPRLLLLYPAILFGFTGLLLGGLITFRQLAIANLRLDVHTLYYASIFLLVASLLYQCYALALYYGERIGFYPSKRKSGRWLERTGSDRIFGAGIISCVIGLILSVWAVWKWGDTGFRELDPSSMFRLVIPAGFLIVAGMQAIVFSFLVSLVENTREKNET